MLSSIHPLGERARSQRWSTTVSSYLLGSAFGGFLTGLAAGSIGMMVGLGLSSTPARAWAVAAVAGLGFWLDFRRTQLPTLHRQVNEDWLTTYRGWVYGSGFGFQLGLGWSTIITTSLVYSTFMVAALTASPALGAVIGLVFGVVRATPILSASRVQNPRQLASFHRTMERWAPKARTAGIATQAVVAIAIAGSTI